MFHSLDTADRKIVFGAIILCVLLIILSALIFPSQTTGESGVPSSYSASLDGAKGAFMLLQELGFKVSRWELPPTELPPGDSHLVLILADPIFPPSEDERYAINQFLQRGGRVIATGSSASRFLPDAKRFQTGDPFQDPQSFAALFPSPLARGAPQITMRAPINWAPISLRKIAVYGSKDTAAVVTYRFGKGQVIWWASATPLTNQFIRQSGNLAFFLNCVGRPRQVKIFWDEYFHGIRGSLLTFLARTPLLWGLMQMCLIFLVIIATYSRRLGPIRLPVTQSRLSPMEFVDTLGDLYTSANASSTAVGVSYRRFRFILTRKLGLPIDFPCADLAKRASENLGWEEEPLLQAMSRCELAAKNDHIHVDQPLALVQQLHDYSVLLEGRGSDTKERKLP